VDMNEYVKSLNVERMRVWEQAKAHLDRIHAEGRSEMSGEEHATWQRYNERIDEIDGIREKYSSRERAEVDAANVREAHGEVFGAGNRPHLGGGEEDLIRKLAGGDPFVRSIEIPLDKVAKERRMLRDGASGAEVRALLWDTGSVGSAVPTTMAHSMYEVMEAEICMLSAPTTRITTSSGEPMQFPKMVTHGIGTQVIAQGTAIGGTDPTFLKMQLDAFKYGELVQVASEVMMDSAVEMGGLLGRDMGRALGRVIDTDLVLGTGSGEPQGIMTSVAGAGTIATGGTLITPTYEKLIDLVYSVNSGYRSRKSVAWIMSDQCAGQLRKLRSGNGGTEGPALWEPSVTAGIVNGQPDVLLGYPVYTDPNIASCASNARIMIFGDLNAYYVRQVGNPVIERSDEYAFNTDLVTLRAKWRIDGDLIDTSGAINIMKQSV
jgi:HK97 family phage major capsid protein